MGGFSAGQELSLFSCLYAGADERICVQGLHMAGVAQGAGRDVQTLGAWDCSPGAGQQGRGRLRQISARKNSVYPSKNPQVTANMIQGLPWQTEIPTCAHCSPQADGGAQLCMEAEVAIKVFFSFFPVGRSPASARVVSKPHTVRHLQG